MIFQIINDILGKNIINAILKINIILKDYKIYDALDIGTTNDNNSESSNFLRNAFIVAIFLMGIILLAQFNSFYSVFVVLTAVIFSTAGVFLGLLITGSNFSITMSGIGTIALAGIVVNNNIVLVDTFNKFNNGSITIRDAVIKTGMDRFRPVLLTTATTVLGLVPTATMVNINFFDRSVTVGDPVTLWWSFMTQAII